MADTLNAREEAIMMTASKKAADLIAAGMSPTDAVEKVARDNKFGPGWVRTLTWACNTAQQLAQMNSNTSILDKFASFDLADPDVVIDRMYPQTPTLPAQEMAKTALDVDYQFGPSWLPDRRRLEVQRRDLGGTSLTKEAQEQSAALKAGSSRLTPEGRLRQAYGGFERCKIAFEEARRLSSVAHDKLMQKIAELTEYFKRPLEYRLPVATVEAVARIKHGAAADDLIDLAVARCPKASREKRAGDKPPLIREVITSTTRPFALIDAAIKAAEDVLVTASKAGAAFQTMEKYAEEHLAPFVPGRTPARPDQSPRTFAEKVGSFSPLGWGVEVGAIASGDILAHNATRAAADNEPITPEEEAVDAEIARVRAQSARARRRLRQPARVKQAVFASPAMGAALGTAAARIIGDVPKERSGLVEDSWLDLEDPNHQNEIRKIRSHAMLNSMLTDPDDPISGHDPDSVINAFNEISSLAPRVAEQAAAIRPLLHRRLQGNVQPFEAKEITDIEKGIAATRSKTPSGGILSDAPDSILG